MIKVAVTGNIAAGKSLVEKFIKEAGHKVIDTDSIAHDIVDMNAPAIIRMFNKYDITENGKISRRKLGDVIFKDADMRKKLEKMVHPQVKEEINRFFETNSDEFFGFVSVPLLFETGMQNMFDKIIFVYSDDAKRLMHLMQRDNLSRADALARMNAQESQISKLEKSDLVINNNGTAEELKESTLAQIHELFRMI